MYTTTLTSEIATQHIQDLHREASTRRLGKLVERSTGTKQARKARIDLSWPIINRWRVGSAHGLTQDGMRTNVPDPV
jgi:hypothetical protein